MSRLDKFLEAVVVDFRITLVNLLLYTSNLIILYMDCSTLQRNTSMARTKGSNPKRIPEPQAKSRGCHRVRRMRPRCRGLIDIGQAHERGWRFENSDTASRKNCWFDDCRSRVRSARSTRTSWRPRDSNRRR